MISAPVLLIFKKDHEAEFVVATDASKVGFAGVLLQEDTAGSLRPCAYCSRKMKDYEARYIACDREVLFVVEVVSNVWSVYLLACAHFQVAIDHVTLTYLLKQPSDGLSDRQVHWVEQLMPFAHCMSILYRKGSVNEADVVSRRPNFSQLDDVPLRRPVDMFALGWDGKVPNLCYQSNYNVLLVLSADNVSVDDGFLTKLKMAYSSSPFFADEKAR
jgi:hypothetical protein